MKMHENGIAVEMIPEVKPARSRCAMTVDKTPSPSILPFSQSFDVCG